MDVVKLYVCPNCDNYIGYTDMGKLEEKRNEATIGPMKQRDRGSRAICPDCGEMRIERWARLIDHSEVAVAKTEVRKNLGASDVVAL